MCFTPLRCWACQKAMRDVLQKQGPSRLLPPPSSYLRFRLHLAQHCVETVKTRLPERAVALQPLVRFLEPPGLDAAGTPLRVTAARDQAGTLEHFQMLGD